MKIRGNAIGTTMKPENNLVKAKSLTDEQKAQARKNIGAMQNGLADRYLNMGDHPIGNVLSLHFTPTDKDDDAISIRQISSTVDDNGSYIGGVFAFVYPDGHVILRGVADGVEDNDAATVGQLNTAVGDIETALDSIISIQESLIGGAV